MSKEKTVQLVSGFIQLSKSEIDDFVDGEVLEKIRKEDKSPMFVKMVVGYEGDSKGEIVRKLSSGEKIKDWLKQLWPLRAVKSLVSRLKEEEVPLYEAHDITNKSRKSVGVVLNATREIIGGVSHAIAVAYIKSNETRKKILEGVITACSVEATCLFEKADNIARYIVREVRDVSGVALCDSKRNPPGFDDANIVAVVTAMAKRREDDDDDDSDDKDEKRSSSRKETVMEPVSLRDVKDFIEKHGTRPGDLFSVEQLTGDPKVKGALDSAVKEKEDGLAKEIKSLNDELKPFRAERARSKVADAVRKSDILKDSDKKLVEYLAKTVRVSGDTEDLQSAVDAAIKEQMEVLEASGASLSFGKKDDKKKDTGKDDKTNQTKVNKKYSRLQDDDTLNNEDASDEDFVNPEVNDLIPT